ncbi:MAG: hypothetical protein WBB28_01850 [Crinalium sp.]
MSMFLKAFKAYENIRLMTAVFMGYLKSASENLTLKGKAEALLILVKNAIVVFIGAIPEIVSEEVERSIRLVNALRKLTIVGTKLIVGHLMSAAITLAIATLVLLDRIIRTEDLSN